MCSLLSRRRVSCFIEVVVFLCHMSYLSGGKTGDIILLVLRTRYLIGWEDIITCQRHRGKKMIDDPAQGNPYDTFPRAERRDFWGVGIPTVYGRTLTYPPRFKTWGAREICF